MKVFFLKLCFLVPLYFFAQEPGALPGKWELVLEKRGDCDDSALVKKIKETSLLQSTGKILELVAKGTYATAGIFGEHFTSSQWKLLNTKSKKEIIFFSDKKKTRFLQFTILFLNDEKMLIGGGNESCKYYLLKKSL